MKNLIRFGAAVLVVTRLLTACAQGFPGDLSSDSLCPWDLQCEYLTEPLGIDVAAPCLSWKLPALAGVRGQKQTAYRVLVASRKSLLETGRADLWDSGIVTSPQSSLVAYGGHQLVSDQDCYWKVRVFDQAGQPSDWSSTARFSLGLLSPVDWTGPWIKHPNAPAEKHIWYRKDFVLDQAAASAFIHVASVGYHELYINGQKVDDRILAPALTRLDRRVFYVTYDAAPLLKAGTNTIALWTGPGWSRYSFFKTHPALRVQMNGLTRGGKPISVASDTTWRSAVSSSENSGKTMFMDNGGEKMDARKYLPGWNAVVFDDSAWPMATATTIDATLSAQMIPATRVIEAFKALSVKRERAPTNQTYLVDLGRNFSGWLEIKFNGLAAGDGVTIKVANRSDTAQDFGQRSEYVAKGRNGEAFQNRFNYACGRYVTLEGLKQPPQPSDITGYAIGTDFRRTGHFDCSEELFNRIYETDLWTYRCNTVEGYTSDCPHRERLGYGEESFATAWGIGLPNYDSGAFYANLVRDWSDVQETNGWINHTAPQINEHYGGPMWSSCGLNISWEHYETFGDRRVMELNYPYSKRWLEFLAGRVQDGLLQNYANHWGKFLGDWAAPGQRRERGGSPEAQYFNNCVYAFNLETFINLAQTLNHPEDVALYRRRLDELKPRINRAFFNPTNDLYCGGNQVRQAFALLTGIVPGELRPAVEGTLEQEFTTHPYFDMGSSGLPVLLKYLVEDSPHPELAFGPLARTEEPSYGYFLKRGENTWPEYWNVDVTSRVHTCYTGIASWFMKDVAGIRPDPGHPGYQSFLIEPLVTGDLTFAEGSTQSPYGQIKSRWEKKGDLLKLEVTVPPNSSATIHLPTSDTKSVTESGKPISLDEGVTVLQTAGNLAVVRVESGHYLFAAKR